MEMESELGLQIMNRSRALKSATEFRSNIERCVLVALGVGCVTSASAVFAGDPCGNPKLGSCFVVRAQPGCSDAVCCGSICAADPFCCDVEWDYQCRQEANDDPSCHAPVPANDDAAGALFVSTGLIPFTTIGASDSASTEIPAVCGGVFGDEIHRDVWFEYRAGVTGIARFSLCPASSTGAWTDYDAILVAHDPLTMETIACNDEGFLCGGYPILEFAVVSGERYLLQVGGHGVEIGTGEIRASESGVSAPTAVNNTCADAELIAVGTTVDFDLLGATRDNATCADTLDDVWFRVAPLGEAGVLSIRVCGSDGPARVEVAVGACDDSHECGEIAACAASLPLDVEVSAKESVLIRVASLARAIGTIETSFKAVQECPPDRNGDGVVNAADLSQVLAYWGTPYEDINGDGLTNAADLSLVLAYWGPCQ